MKVTLFLCVFLAVVTFAYCGQALVPGKSGKCFYSETGPMQPGEVKEIKNKCTQATCDKDGTIKLISCGSAVVDGKKVEPDYTKPYPQCCNVPEH